MEKKNRVAVSTEAELVDCRSIAQENSAFSCILSIYSDPHANIGICIPNSAAYINWLTACYKSGRVAVPIFFGSSKQEILNTVVSCDLQVLVYSPELDLSYLMDQCEAGLTLVNCETLQIISNEKSRPVSKAPDDTAIMISTSGSVDNPKRVMLSAANVLTNARDIIDSLSYEPSDVFMVILPACFASANTSQIAAAFVLGAKLVTYRGILHPAKIASCIQKYGVTTITVTPPLFKLIAESPAFTYEKLPSLKTICFGGGPTDIETIERARAKFSGINLTQMYGQTETSTRISHMRLQKDSWISASVGKPIGNMKVRIADNAGNILPTGSEGRIQVRGDSIFSGYYNQPELTAEAFVNGWLNTGDIGKLDAAGNIYITGRERNLIIYCGFNVYPEEIENVLSAMEGIEDALVYGETHPQYGEIIVADIQLQDGAKTGTNEVLQHCHRFLPTHKIPAEIHFVQSLKKTPNGKKARKK